MQLMPCRGCEAPVSVEAAACPRCGHPTMLGKQSPSRAVATVIVVIGALVTIGMLVNIFSK